MPPRRPLAALAMLTVRLALLLSFSVGAAAQEPKHCRYTNFATIPVEMAGGKVLLDGTINGSATVMMVDTGSDWTSLTRKAAETLRLKLGHLDMYSVGIGGESALYQTMVDDITFGKLHWHRTRLAVIWDGDGLDPYGALLGADILFFSDIEISLAKGELKFFEAAGCSDDAFLAYWDPQAVAIPMREMSPTDKRQIVEVEVNGKKMRAMIDSGTPTTVINLAAAARAGVTPQSPGVVEIGTSGGIGKHSVKSWRARFKSFSIGEETVMNPPLRMMDLYGSALADSDTSGTRAMLEDAPDILLGADFLRAHRVLFSVSQRRLYLSYLGGKAFDAETAPDAAPDSHEN